LTSCYTWIYKARKFSIDKHEVQMLVRSPVGLWRGTTAVVNRTQPS